MEFKNANVYDQDQGLTGRYHNTTLDTNKIIQALYYKPGASRARIHKLDIQESQRKQQYLSTDINQTRLPSEGKHKQDTD